MPGKALVIDANILVRAVLGRRVREIIETSAGQVSFFVPEVAYTEAEEHVPTLVVRRGGDPEKAVRFLRSLRALVELIGREVYGDYGIGRYWRRRWQSGAPSGRKTPISSGAECPLGRPAESPSFCASLRSSREQRHRMWPAFHRT
jgi:hypothetical protein